MEKVKSNKKLISKNKSGGRFIMKYDGGGKSQKTFGLENTIIVKENGKLRYYQFDKDGNLNYVSSSSSNSPKFNTSDGKFNGYSVEDYAWSSLAEVQKALKSKQIKKGDPKTFVPHPTLGSKNSSTEIPKVVYDDENFYGGNKGQVTVRASSPLSDSSETSPTDGMNVQQQLTQLGATGPQGSIYGSPQGSLLGKRYETDPAPSPTAQSGSSPNGTYDNDENQIKDTGNKYASSVPETTKEQIEASEKAKELNLLINKYLLRPDHGLFGDLYDPSPLYDGAGIKRGYTPLVDNVPVQMLSQNLAAINNAFMPSTHIKIADNTFNPNEKPINEYALEGIDYASMAALPFIGKLKLPGLRNLYNSAKSSIGENLEKLLKIKAKPETISKVSKQKFLLQNFSEPKDLRNGKSIIEAFGQDGKTKFNILIDNNTREPIELSKVGGSRPVYYKLSDYEIVDMHNPESPVKFKPTTESSAKPVIESASTKIEDFFKLWGKNSWNPYYGNKYVNIGRGFVKAAAIEAGINYILSPFIRGLFKGDARPIHNEIKTGENIINWFNRNSPETKQQNIDSLVKWINKKYPYLKIDSVKTPEQLNDIFGGYTLEDSTKFIKKHLDWKSKNDSIDNILNNNSSNTIDTDITNKDMEVARKIVFTDGSYSDEQIKELLADPSNLKLIRDMEE